MANVILRFAKRLTKYDPLLRARVEGLYHKIFEGAGTNAALDSLRNKVGDNSLETEGDGVFGLSGAAGFDGEKVPNDNLDAAIDSGIEAGNFDDFGTAISQETAPVEEDFGLGDEPPLDGGPDLFGPEDTGASSDLGLDGLDDEVPDEPGPEGGSAIGEPPVDGGELPEEPGEPGGDEPGTDNFDLSELGL